MVSNIGRGFDDRVCRIYDHGYATTICLQRWFRRYIRIGGGSTVHR